jgi:hypothetical protein
MYPSRRGSTLLGPGVAVRLSIVAGLLVSNAGCATRNSSDQRSGVAGPPSQAIAHVRPEIEDDGLPAQLAPRRRQPEPDDPGEPWSPNYGTRRPGQATEPHARTLPSRASVERRDGMRQPVLQMSDLDADDLIRRAIAEHEMRRGE